MSDTPGKGPNSVETLASNVTLMVTARLILAIGGPIGAALFSFVVWQAGAMLSNIQGDLRAAVSGIHKNALDIAVIQERAEDLKGRVAAMEQDQRAARRN